MKPQIPIDTVLRQASALLAEPLSGGRAADMGADHLVVFATAPGHGPIIIKVGEDAHADAHVLGQLQNRPVRVPRLLARGMIQSDGQDYPALLMSRIAGVDLATVADQHHYLPALVAQMRQVHRVTTTRGAGTVLRVVEGSTPTTWKAYLLAILRGENPEFAWETLATSLQVDARVLRRSIASLIEAVEALPEPATYHLLHGDLNPFNILVADGRITGIIDWSYARYGDPLFDFARLRMNPFVRQVPAATDAYFALLSPTPEERRREEIYFRFNLVEYVNWYTQSHFNERVREHIALLEHQTGR